MAQDRRLARGNQRWMGQLPVPAGPVAPDEQLAAQTPHAAFTLRP
ncbi:hypothetical protein [Paenibacillus sacheonensis]|nr:hypothetical protein [Paenibacillus sacheonensis]MBM7568937.1 hypothetical protein [Paenibacillus sacheonensis]